MVTKRGLAQGLAALATAYGREVDESMLALYHDMCSPEFASDDEWIETVKDVIKEERFWPAPAVLLERRRRRLCGAQEVFANRLFEHIRKWGKSYSPAGGTYYNRGDIEKKYGPVVTNCLDRAGGVRLFDADEKGIGFAKRMFVRSWVDEAPSCFRPQLPMTPEWPSLPAKKDKDEEEVTR